MSNIADLQVFAAGSLRKVWPALMAVFEQQTGNAVISHFAPAGLLRQRIVNDEPCDLFASANLAHPQVLLQQGRAVQIGIFTRNQLCLTAKASQVDDSDNWLTLLSRPQLRLATSTPVSDPSGDYAWQLFDIIEQRHAGVGANLKTRAMPLVGGTNTMPIPPGQQAASWLINNDHAELFIGYHSYAAELSHHAELRVFSIPRNYQPEITYGFALCQPRAAILAEFLLSPAAQRLLQAAGFGQ